MSEEQNNSQQIADNNQQEADVVEDGKINDKMINDKKEKHGFFHHKCGKCEEYKAGWQRAQADYQNLKREVESMRGEWARMSEQQILEEFLPVYDNFKLAFGLQTSDYGSEQQNWVKGIECIMKQFEKILKDHGVEQIKTVGEIFNPELHEAIGEEASDLPEHTIVREVEAGYMMKGKVIKVAKVIVAKMKNENIKNENDN